MGRNDLENEDQVMPLKKTQPKPTYEPGTVIAYSNYSTNLAGYIIEQVTGRDYVTYMNQAVHDQLQMDQSIFSMIDDDQSIIEK